MFNKRSSIFETNSSSSHSISIKTINPIVNKIPLNATIYVDGSCTTQYNTTEISKLNEIVGLVTSFVDNCEDKIDSFEVMIKHVPQFQWIIDVVKKHTGSTIVYKKCYEDYPWLVETSDDEVPVSLILACNLYDEIEFKKRIEEIIFNPEIIITDLEENY